MTVTLPYKLSTPVVELQRAVILGGHPYPVSGDARLRMDLLLRLRARLTRTDNLRRALANRREGEREW